MEKGQRSRRRVDELDSLHDDLTAVVAGRCRCRSASRRRTAARRTTSWGRSGHARACRSTLVGGLSRPSPRHHGIGDGPHMDAEKHALRLRTSSAGSLTASKISSSWSSTSHCGGFFGTQIVRI